MRGALSLLLVLLVCLGCVACGGSQQAFTVREVERVFAEHGLPFATEVRPTAKNPYLKASVQSFFGLPPAKEHALDRHLWALLVEANPRTYTTREAYVFDSAASLQRAHQLVPGMLTDRKGSRTVKGNSTSESGCSMHRENVFVLASYQYCKRVRVILADLR